MKVALVYDWVHTFGGAERILLELHDLFPEASLFTAVYDSSKTPWAKVFKIKTSFLQKIPFAASHHEFFPLLTPVAFENFIFDEFDLVISVTSSDAKGIITKPSSLHICYLLTPTRYIWSHQNFYLSNPFLKLISSPFISYLKKWDSVAKTRPDHLIAISKTVQERTKKYYGEDCDVIYPPVSVDKFSPSQNGRDDYFLVVSRLVPYKRIDLVIYACNKLNLPLVIIGTGRQENFLKQISGPTVTMLKNLTEDDLISYYQNCRALIMPSEEDFGIVSVEAQALGKPVIAFGAGGAKETVKDSITGLFFKEQTVDSLIETLNNFENYRFSRESCIENSKQYSIAVFKKRFTKKIEEYLEKFNKNKKP